METDARFGAIIPFTEILLHTEGGGQPWNAFVGGTLGPETDVSVGRLHDHIVYHAELIAEKLIMETRSDSMTGGVAFHVCTEAPQLVACKS